MTLFTTIALTLASFATPCATEDSHRCVDYETSTVHLFHTADPSENDSVPTAHRTLPSNYGPTITDPIN